MQSKEELEKFYEKKDPWGYQNNIEDIKRKDFILDTLEIYKPKDGFSKALDLGAGEGWITKDLPAKEIYGYDISEKAMSRFPKNVKVWDMEWGKFEIILATGILYKQYNFKWFLDKIRKHAIGKVLTCNIASWEINDLPKELIIYETKFSYRQYTEHLVVYDFFGA